MNILWISNIVFPSVCDQLGLPKPVSGGWLYARAKQLTQTGTVSLAVATVYKGKRFYKLEFGGIKYYLIPISRLDKYQTSLEGQWKTICEEFKPDIVHVNGTEYPHGLACMNALPMLKYAVSIQGLVSIISRYYYGGMSLYEIAENTSLLELLGARSIWSGKRGMTKRGRWEREYIQRADAISGRTTWDFAHIKTINPNVPYYYSPRTLRATFYSSPSWHLEKMAPHTIFLSKGTSPFKGMHQVLRAAAIVLGKFPDLTIRVAGKDMLVNTSMTSRLRCTAYQRFLLKLVGSTGLQDKIHFTGRLSEEQMVEELLTANVFICPSSIENSSNSIAEAQMLGVPTIASDVGGNLDMVEHGVSGFIYRFEEHELLAHYIMRIFEDQNLAVVLSENSRRAAKLRHDTMAGLDADILMYKDLFRD